MREPLVTAPFIRAAPGDANCDFSCLLLRFFPLVMVVIQFGIAALVGELCASSRRMWLQWYIHCTGAPMRPMTFGEPDHVSKLMLGFPNRHSEIAVAQSNRT